MGMIQNLLKGISKNKKEFKEKFKQAEEEHKINNMLEERQKSSNQRELEKYMKEKHEENIKIKLDKIRKQKNKESWKSPHSVLSGGKSILHEDRPILKEKNIFRHGKMSSNQGGMFFK